jgi:hypothetical protein
MLRGACKCGFAGLGLVVHSLEALPGVLSDAVQLFVAALRLRASRACATYSMQGC